MGFWLEFMIGMLVVTLLVVVLGPGLWSSRLNLKKSDDPPRDKGSKPDKQG